MAGSLFEERGPLASGSPLLTYTHTTSGMPTHLLPFSPPFPLLYALISGCANPPGQVRNSVTHLAKHDSSWEDRGMEGWKEERGEMLRGVD